MIKEENRNPTSNAAAEIFSYKFLNQDFLNELESEGFFVFAATEAQQIVGGIGGQSTPKC
jgi:hypothetical protein